MVAEFDQFAILASCLGFEGGGEPMELLGLFLKPIVAGGIEKDMVVNIPILGTLFAVAIVQDE